MIYKEKGFTLKGLTLGEYIDGCMIVGIDDSQYLVVDVATLKNEPTGELLMSEVIDDGGEVDGTLYGLKEYENSDVKWLDSYKY